MSFDPLLLVYSLSKLTSALDLPFSFFSIPSKNYRYLKGRQKYKTVSYRQNYSTIFFQQTAFAKAAANVKDFSDFAKKNFKNFQDFFKLSR
jgi:hypothetical protein